MLDHAQEQGAAGIARLERDEPLELRSRLGGPIARLQHETELVVRLGDLRSDLEARPIGELGVGQRAARRQHVAEEEELRRSPGPELARARERALRSGVVALEMLREPEEEMRVGR